MLKFLIRHTPILEYDHTNDQVIKEIQFTTIAIKIP